MGGGQKFPIAKREFPLDFWKLTPHTSEIHVLNYGESALVSPCLHSWKTWNFQSYLNPGLPLRVCVCELFKFFVQAAHTRKWLQLLW